MTNPADALLVAEVLARANHGIPDDEDWATMVRQTRNELEERTRPADEEVVLRERYLPRYAHGNRWNVLLAEEEWERAEGQPHIIAYDPLVGEYELF